MYNEHKAITVTEKIILKRMMPVEKRQDAQGAKHGILPAAQALSCNEMINVAGGSVLPGAIFPSGADSYGFRSTVNVYVFAVYGEPVASFPD